VYYKP